MNYYSNYIVENVSQEEINRSVNEMLDATKKLFTKEKMQKLIYDENLKNYPIGCYYEQWPDNIESDLKNAFPEEEKPANLFGGIWELIPYKDIYFTTGGGIYEKKNDIGYKNEIDQLNNRRLYGQERMQQQIVRGLAMWIIADESWIHKTGFSNQYTVEYIKYWTKADWIVFLTALQSFLLSLLLLEDNISEVMHQFSIIMAGPAIQDVLLKFVELILFEIRCIGIEAATNAVFLVYWPAAIAALNVPTPAAPPTVIPGPGSVAAAFVTAMIAFHTAIQTYDTALIAWLTQNATACGVLTATLKGAHTAENVAYQVFQKGRIAYGVLNAALTPIIYKFSGTLHDILEGMNSGLHTKTGASIEIDSVSVRIWQRIG